MANGKIHVHELPRAIDEAVKATKAKIPSHELIMGFIAPDSLPAAEARQLAEKITHTVAPGATVVDIPAGAGGAAQAESLTVRPGRLLGFVAAPNRLQQ